ncbi:uncharacterized protein G2W53_034654 [Senna tora]|uniref:Uncharacterized protein n=1 Tax=Senna tora TaxID=362788 RepID=A0A834W9T2_9FABA|nr:uncharacterized protein G2W53_034654 [Senna tora]
MGFCDGSFLGQLFPPQSTNGTLRP